MPLFFVPAYFYRLLFTISVLIKLISFTPAFAQKTLQISAQTSEYDLSQHLRIVEDKHKTYTLTQILTPKIQQIFERSLSGKVNFGYTSSNFWVKLSVQNPLPEATDWYVELTYPLLDSITFYDPDTKAQSGWQAITIGDRIPFAERNIPYKNATFELHLPAQSTKIVYFKVATESSVQLTMRLIKKEYFYLSKMPEQLFYGVYFGMIIIMILYNFFVFLTLRDVLYFYYCIFTFSLLVLLSSLSGHFFQYVVPTSPYWANVLVLVSSGMSILLLQLFSTSFLDTKHYLPGVYWFQRGVAVAAGVMIVMSFTFSYGFMSKINLIILLVGLLVVLLSSFGVWFLGNTSARFFILAWTSFLLAAVIFILRNLSLLPNTAIINHAIEVANAMEVMLLSLALGDKYSLFRKQTEKAQAELLQIQREANERLEQKVKERTRKLQETTEELQVLNEELNSANEELQTNIDLVEMQKSQIEEANKLLAEWQKNMQDSIEYARNIQNAMLQVDKNISTKLSSYAIFWQPRDVISGDFYYFKYLNDQLFVAAVDCTGHGVPGAFMSVLGMDLLNDIISNRQIYEPQNILLALHEGILIVLNQVQTRNKDGMDVALVRIDFEQAKISFAGAKNPLIVIHNNQLNTYKGDKYSVGGELAATQVQFSQQTIALQKGMLLYLFSDGIEDQFGGEQDTKFLRSRLKELLLTHANQPLTLQKQILEQTLRTWQGNKPQTDDMLLIALQV